MKDKFISIVLSIVLCVVAFGVFGCSTEQMGETVAEGHRRHIRISRINRQALIEDIDAVFQIDRPTRLAEKKIP